MRRSKLLTGLLLIAVTVGSLQVQGKESQNSVKAAPVTKVSEKSGKKASKWGYLPVKDKVFNKKDLVEGRSRHSTRTTIPESYDARDEGIVTDVKDQGNYGTCWDFGALGAAESGILKKGLAQSVDLSELQLAYSAYNKFIDPLNLTEEDIWHPQTMSNGIYNLGGNDDLVTGTLAHWQGTVEEEDAPYTTLQDAEDTVTLEDELMYQKDSYHLQNAEYVYLSTPSTIKERILENGCATISYHAAEGEEEERLFQSKDGSSIYTDPEHYKDGDMELNHTVLLVGWDDNYEVSKFNKRNHPNAPGAWLFRNSWGTGFGDDGYFWISYEDAALNDSGNEVVFYDMEAADNYDKNYQYDGGVYNSFYSGYDKMANIYTAESKEKLEAVSFWTPERNVSYEINVYKVSDETNPESGERLCNTISGVLQERGYHTIDFSEQRAEDVPLAAGDKFSVVVRLVNEDKKCSGYAVEEGYEEEGMKSGVSADVGESFLYKGGSWEDCKEFVDGNVCLKAFTSVVDDVPCQGITSNTEGIVVKVRGSQRVVYQLIPADATGMITWRSEDCGVASVSNGVVFGNTAGNTTITGTINGHTIRVPVTVGEKPATEITLPETLELYRNEKAQLTPVITPEDSTDDIIWSSADPSAVRVNEFGEVFAIDGSSGPVLVTATTSSGKTAQCEVTVRSKDPYDATLEDMQSQHPYETECETFYEYARENAIGYKVTFSEDTYLEPDGDFLYILNEEGEEVEGYTYTGDELAGKTISIPYSRILLELEADELLVYFGFQITNIEPLYPATASPTPTQKPDVISTPVPTMPVVSPSSIPTPTAPVVLPSSTPASTVPVVSPLPMPTVAPGSQSKVIVKSMKFKPVTKKVNVGKKIKLSKYLKVTKKKSGKVKVTYQFTKKKYKKYATLSGSGVLKAKKKGRKKTVVVCAKAGDGSGKSAKIQVKIQ